jgi:predicted phage tail protein
MNDTRQDTNTHTGVYRAPAVTTDNEPSLGDIVVGLTDDLTTLVRKEVELAKAEVQESIQDGAKAGGMVAAGGLLAYSGLLFVLAAIAVLLGDWWNNYWLGALVVGLVAGILGWSILNGGLKQLKQVSLVPRQTISSISRDAEMAKEKLS